MKASSVYDALVELDTTEAVDAAFRACTDEHGAAWAIETMTREVFVSRRLSFLSRSLIDAYGTMADDAWLDMVRAAVDDATRQLISGVWRCNSSSMMANLMHQCDAEAYASFVDSLRRQGMARS